MNIKWERRSFYGAVGLYLIPLCYFTPFVTLDGPVHAYNAGLMVKLISGTPAWLGEIHCFNPVAEPNWTGHLFLMILQTFITGLLAEKVLQLFILLGTAWSYRNFCLFLLPSQTSRYYSWTVFPLLYSFPFLMGFYNYCIALIIFPWLIMRVYSAAGLQHRHFDPVLVLLFALGYFSHLLVFALGLMAAGLFLLFDRANTDRLRSVVRLVLHSLPFALLWIWFMQAKGLSGHQGVIQRLPWSELLAQYYSQRALIMYRYDDELPAAIAAACFSVGLLILAFRSRSLNRFQRPALACLGLMSVLHLSLPDSFASGGIISIRLSQFFWLWLAWLTLCFNPPIRLSRFAAAGAAVIAMVFICLHFPVWKSLSSDAANWIALGRSVQSPALLVPVNSGSNWMHSNFAAYTAMSGNSISLDNYEADQRHFPLVWKEGFNPEADLGNFMSSAQPCLRIREFEKKHRLSLAFVITSQFRPSTDDSCSMDLSRQLLEFYEPPEPVDAGLQLYRRKISVY